MKEYKLLVFLGLISIIFCHDDEYHTTPEDIKEAISSRVITYGSVVRIQNYNSQYFLHSHDIKYGSGSQQQTITGYPDKNDQNSLFIIKGKDGEDKHFQQIVKCGDIIRLEHSLTQKNIHTHNIQSPISHNLEVSAYGREGEGDEADDWIIQCVQSSYYWNKIVEDNRQLTGADYFVLKNKLLGAYLGLNKAYVYNQSNCGRNCPIAGQLEVYAIHRLSQDSLFSIHSGVFYNIPKDAHDDHINNINYDNRQYITDDL